MTEKKIIIYARVSTEDKQDCTRQITELKQRIRSNANHSILPIEIISEKISGYKLKDGSLLEILINNIKESPAQYECVYVWEISRLGRNPLETRERVETLLSNNVNIYVETLQTLLTNDINGFGGSITKILLMLLLEFAHLETQQTKLRIKSGLLQSARNGRVGGGINIPYGYRKGDNKMLIIDEEESVIIQRIFDLYKLQFGIRRISGILNSQNVPTRYNLAYKDQMIKNKRGYEKLGKDVKWSDKQIHDILKNRIYIGERQFKGETIKCPSIIDMETFDNCNELLKSKFIKSEVKHIFLLKQLMKCNCGRNFVGVNKADEKVYKCSSRLIKGASCGMEGINIKMIESVILNIALMTSHIINFVKSSQDLKDKITKDVIFLGTEILELEDKIRKKNTQFSKLLDDSLSSYFNIDLISQKSNNLNKEIKNLEHSLNLKINERVNKNKFLSKKLDTNFDIINNAKKDRKSLQEIFNEIFSQIVVEKITRDYLFIEVKINVFENRNITYKLKVHRSQERKKIKKYIYSVESVFLNIPNSKTETDSNILIPFNRCDYIENQNFSERLPIKKNNITECEIPQIFEREHVDEEDFLYVLERSEPRIFPLLKMMFHTRFQNRYMFPIEIPNEFLISI